jgi:hypothetical protein
MNSANVPPKRISMHSSNAGAKEQGETIWLVGETPVIFRAVNRDQVRRHLAQADRHIAELKSVLPENHIRA